MADKSIYAFSKIEGARALIDRIKEVFHDKRNSDQLSLDDIVTINKIFQEVLS